MSGKLEGIILIGHFDSGQGRTFQFWRFSGYILKNVHHNFVLIGRVFRVTIIEIGSITTY